MEKLLRYKSHFFAVIGFIVLALLYFHPVIQGKQILQNDIVQYTGMAKEMNDFRAEFNEESYWNNSVFGGMPTYQLGAKYPHNYIKQLDSVIRFLPRPADYLFLYFIGFYILLVSLKIPSLKAFIGALLFGFSTYLIIIIGAGHNAKAHAIAYMPLLVAGVLMVFQKRYWLGAIVTFLAAALEIQANHFQMTYYLLFLLIIIALYFTIEAFKKKEVKEWGISILLLLVSAVLAVGVNATSLLATSEYTEFSTRSNSELTTNADGSLKTDTNAMSHEYITEYSYGIFETLNLVSSKITGGANNENIGTDSNTYQFVYNFLSSNGYDPSQALQFAEHAPTYWGAQPIVAAPAYIGAIVVFLAILGLFIEKRKIKYIFAIGALVSIVLSWGKYFPLTDLLIDILPLYNKFRAVASIQVIAELCIPVLAVMGLYSYFQSTKEEQFTGLKKSVIAFGSIFALLILGYLFGSFQSESDMYYAQNFGNNAYGYIEALVSDRKNMYIKDLFRTFALVAVVIIAMYLSHKDKLSQKVAVYVVGALAVIDLVAINLNYVNKDNFVPKIQVNQPFQPTEADLLVAQKEGDFRVFDQQGAFNSARASYFHQALGGYHAAKPKKVQELMDYQISNQNLEILNMYNVKYVLTTDEAGQVIPLENPSANGNAWFVKDIKVVSSADEAMESLSTLKSKETAVVQENFAKKLKNSYTLDSIASVQLIQNKPNHLIYKSSNTNDGLVVFSENYYPKGWNVLLDGRSVEMIEVNYTLRGLAVPSGSHTIEFKFEPEVVKKGSLISLVSTILGLLFIIGCFFIASKKCKTKKEL